MAIPNQQIGWSEKSKLLSYISKQLEKLTQVTGNTSVCPPQGTLPFFATIYFGEGFQDACAQSYPLFAVGDSTTFCSSTNFISEAFNSVGTGTIFIAYNGNLRQVSVVSGSNIAIATGACTSCPTVYAADYALLNAVDACTAPTSSPNVYSPDSVLVTGSPLFYNIDLTEPVDDGHYLIAGNVYSVINSNVETNEGPCPLPNMSLTVSNSLGLFDIAENSDFTIEWGVYLGTDDNHPRMYSFGSYFSGGASHAVSIENGTFYWWVNGSIILSVNVSVLNAWYYFTVQRSSGVVQIYLDGTSLGSVNYTDAIPTDGKPLYIGSEGDDSLASALFSNFRWNSTQAVHNPAGFTPPAAPLTSIYGTNLLLFQGNTQELELTDNSGQGSTINNGTGLYTEDNPYYPTYEGSIAFGF